MSKPNKCAYMTFRGVGALDRPEFCPNDVDTPFSENYCGDHLPEGPLSPEDYEGDHE